MKFNLVLKNDRVIKRGTEVVALVFTTKAKSQEYALGPDTLTALGKSGQIVMRSNGAAGIVTAGKLAGATYHNLSGSLDVRVDLSEDSPVTNKALFSDPGSVMLVLTGEATGASAFDRAAGGVTKCLEQIGVTYAAFSDSGTPSPDWVEEVGKAVSWKDAPSYGGGTADLVIAKCVRVGKGPCKVAPTAMEKIDKMLKAKGAPIVGKSNKML